MIQTRRGINALKRAGGIFTAAEKRVYRSGLISPTRLSLPDFLGIGLPRAGTTWLYKNLAVHPDIYFPSKKELHYFNRHLQRTLRSYVRNFATAQPRQTKGEITPDYAYLDFDRIRLIHDLMPGARLVLLLRNPIERAWSDIVRVLVKRTGRSVRDIELAQWKDHLTRPTWRARNRYTAVLDNWSAAYPTDQIFVGFFDDIRDDPRGLLAAVFDHLGVSTPENWNNFPLRGEVNQGPGDPMPDEVRRLLTELCREELALLHQRFGDRVSHWRFF